MIEMITRFYRQLFNLIDFTKLDLITFFIFACLSLFGLLAVATASLAFSDSISGYPLNFFTKQLFHFLLGLLIMFFVITIPMAFWEKIDRWLLSLGLFSLLLVFVPGIGTEVNGANRWIRISGFSLQPSEIMKFIIIIYTSGYCVRRLRDIQSHWFAFFKPSVLVIIVVSLILLQPDLGTSTVIFGTVLGILFVAGVQMRQFLLVIGIGFLGTLALIYFVPWRWERIISFMNPWEDPYGSGYQLTLSLMSFARGNWFGVGIGEGLMKMGYLPDAHTDFIFAVIVEEMGLVTGIVILSLLFGLCFRTFYLARQALSRNLHFCFFVGYGVAILIALHTFINIGVATGLLPTKGLTLPFISYGGTHVLVMCALVGLVLRLDYETKLAMPAVNISRRA
ncbi:MAG: putative lipid II flippase FtsW [Gammaproteobacteria bacterium]|nr:putative lipid II flippase FtsW [Gammaproteobacteria bacterium]